MPTRLSLGMRIAWLLGASAPVASMFFVFYQFCGRFDEVIQVAILISARVLSFGLCLYVQDRDSSGYFSELAAIGDSACQNQCLGLAGE